MSGPRVEQTVSAFETGNIAQSAAWKASSGPFDREVTHSSFTPEQSKVFTADMHDLFLNSQMKHDQENLDNFHGLTGKRVDLVEICAPWDSPLAEAVERAGGVVMRLGLHNGYDLSTREGFLKAAWVLRRLKPRYVHLSPPCFPFSCMQNANQRTDQQKLDLEEKQKYGKRILRHCAKLLEIQVQELRAEAGGSTKDTDGGFEQPLRARSWQIPEVQRITKLCGGRFRVDGCQHGMIHETTKCPLLKSYGWLSTHAGIRRSIEKKCNHESHVHQPIEGPLTSKTAVYPPLLCDRFARALMEPTSRFQELLNTVWANASAEEAIPSASALVPAESSVVPGSDADADEQEILRKLRQLHTNLGHPSQSILKRTLKDAGATEQVLRLADRFECVVCRQQGRRAPARPSAAPAVTEVWDTVSMDTFWWSSPHLVNGKPAVHMVGISLMDEASDFHVCSVVRSGHNPQSSISAEEFKRLFSQSWLKFLPKPMTLRYDAEGFFRSIELVQWIESMGIRLQAIAGEAPWQGGKHSRHLATVKQNMTSLSMDLGPKVSCEELLDLVCSTKNELHQIRGFSPNQWSFGQGRGRTESFLQIGDHAPLQSQRQDLNFEATLQKRARARTLFLEEDARRRTQRALLYRQRTLQSFEIGQLVYFFRRGRGHGSRYECHWFGPGKVVCVEKTSHPDHEGELRNTSQGSIVWVAHGTTLYRCAPEQLRRVTREVENVSQMFGRANTPSSILQDAQRSQRYQDILRDVQDLKPDDEIHDQDPDYEPSLIDDEPSLIEPEPLDQEPRRFRVFGKNPSSAYRDGSAAAHCPPPGEASTDSRNDRRESGRTPSSLSGDGPRDSGTGSPDPRSTQGQDVQGGGGPHSLLPCLDPQSSGQQPQVPRSDGLRRAGDPVGNPRRSSSESHQTKGQVEAVPPGVEPSSREEFQRHSLHWRDAHRPIHGESGGESLQHGSLPSAVDPDLHERDAPHESGRSADSVAQPATPGESDADPGPFGTDGRTSFRPGFHHGSSRNQARMRSRSRHRDTEGLIFEVTSELPEIVEEPLSGVSPEQSETVSFEVGCVPPSVKSPYKPTCHWDEIQKGCFAWVGKGELGETDHDISYIDCETVVNQEDFLQTFFVSDKQVVEICLTVAPRDIHLRHRNGIKEWTLNQKPKRHAEVSMKKLSPEDRKEMLVAMKGEIGSFLERDAIEIAARAGVDPKKLLTMRWVLTYKPVTDSEGKEIGTRPKARLIIRGYEDPQLLNLRRDSPTLCVSSRNMLFALAALNNWELFAGDIKTAFLNGDPVPPEQQVFGDPPEEVRSILGMKATDVLRIKKVIYGLLHAPRVWMDKLASVLASQGWQRSRLEQCVWRLYNETGELEGLIGCHVDDLLCVGKSTHFHEKVKLLRNSFPFGSWQKASDENVVFCGCEVKQTYTGDILVSQERYGLGLNEIPVSSTRKQQSEQPVNSLEQRQLRAALGALSWRATQSCPWLSASVSVLQGKQAAAKVEDLLATNKLIRTQRQACEETLRFSADIKKPILISYTDASFACRHDGSSQGGQLCVLADSAALEGHRVPFSPLAWQSRRLPRVARSSTSAEVQMLSNTSDTHEFIKQVLLEWFNPQDVLFEDADRAMRCFPSVLILDSKNLFDAMSRIETSGLHLEEKRTAIDVLSVRERSVQAGFAVKWVDSDQQLADNLSKPNNYEHLRSIFRKGLISIVFDPLFISAKKKRMLSRSLKDGSMQNSTQTELV